ncbi:MAG: putative 2OG-Fe(II) oxygenase [Allosphingosinicella sp.]
MRWGAPLPEDVGRPAIVRALLERAVAAAPENAALHAKLGYLDYDRHDYRAAALSFATALRLGSAEDNLRTLLGRCYNYLGRPADALDALHGGQAANFERGRALMELGDAAGAEREFRAILAGRPDDPGACRMLCRILRLGGRIAELVALCETLAGRGATNAQLLYNWGWALALAGERDRARRLLFDPERIERIRLSVPPGFAGMAEFNRALAEELLGHPDQLSDFAVEDEANRGSRRIDDLFTGRRPDLIRLLLDSIQEAVSAWIPAPAEGFDPWPRARPDSARLRPWGLIQRGDDYEEGHIHPGGWLSGVYYVKVPPAIADASPPGPGCIEFGPPARLAESVPDAPAARYVPSEGLLLLAPSHYRHRTIPSGIDDDRISIAFDVVPDPAA